MTTTALTLPEAKAQLSNAVRRFNILSATIIEPVSRGAFPPDRDDLYLKTVDLLQALDLLIQYLKDPMPIPAEEWADMYQMAHAMRVATYLIICSAKPDQAWYWAASQQERIRTAETALSPDVRAKVLADARATYASLSADEMTALREEDRMFDASIADGID